ncbi:MAG: hypothetical protein CMH21_00515 [Methylophaga sp.]|mgnify:FL=1|uniref:cbb3-type cytochrome oxidase subunit 3 n=1 Tax=unclassified Methylophaga TaxID=2629249 RepID=UPI000C90049D|nr:hypothetical protein [Methylophaga sp.]MAY16213.1 hypothetical protein [Methylophaga sp.]HAO25902.1 hypothetical protein [Methylophaga sp.]HCD03876.1 hypothetical protein [Methylophaga sp.]|tara:strand:- start:3031 stop:3267 length:237 start_codon:yes stop_codon:yes gene_type:complete
MEILLLFLKFMLVFLTSNWLVIVTTLIGVCCMLLIGLWVFHPDNKKVYESYANIPLEDLLEDETSNENDSKTYFSIFL